MYNNIGLASVRGSATSGHVQANSGFVRPSSHRYRTGRNVSGPPRGGGRGGGGGRKGSGGNRGIQEHDKRRRLENRLLEMRERLEDEGRLSEDQIEERIAEERKRETDRWEQQRREREEASERARAEAAVVPGADAGMEGADGGGQEAAAAGEVSADTSAVPPPPPPAAAGGAGAIVPARGPDQGAPDVRGRDNRRWGGGGRGRQQWRDDRGRNRKKDTNAHVEARRKEEENERLRDAFGIDKSTHREGAATPMGTRLTPSWQVV